MRDREALVGVGALAGIPREPALKSEMEAAKGSLE